MAHVMSALRIDCWSMKPRCEKTRSKIPPAPDHCSALTMLRVIVGSILCTGALAQQVDTQCGNPFVNGFGPHDYRVEQGQNRKVVEDYHFTPRVESLVSGTTGSLGGDIDYTLRAFPNHHRALISMMNLGVRMKTPTPPGAQFSVDCYFWRALQFRPDDTIVRTIYAKHLASSGRKPEAIRQLETVVLGTRESAFSQYNAGLVYFEMGEFDRALLQAHRALSLGFDRQGGLRQQLQAAGKWVDAPPAGPGDTSSSADTGTAPVGSAASAVGPISYPQPSR